MYFDKPVSDLLAESALIAGIPEDLIFIHRL